MDAYEIVSMAALLVSYTAVIAFIGYNHWRIDWRHNMWGRHVMRFSYVYVALITIALAFRVFGDYPGRRLVTTAFYCLLAAVMVERLWIVIRANRGRPRQRS